MSFRVEFCPVWIYSSRKRIPHVLVGLQLSVICKRGNCTLTTVFCESAIVKNIINTWYFSLMIDRCNKSIL